jgi:hypothetical protein
MNRPILAAAAFSALVYASVAAGQTTPLPVDAKDSRSVDRWMAQNSVRQDIAGETWVRVAVTEEGIHMRRTRLETPIKAPNNKTKTLVTRLEMFAPMYDRLGKVSSIAFDYDLDCQNERYRDAAINAYPEHNLTGKPRTELFDDERWGPVAEDAMMSAIARDVCNEITGNKGGMVGGGFGGDGRINGVTVGAPTGR